MAHDTERTADQGKPRTDRTHFLYVAVIVAVVLGIGVGLIAPDLR